MPQSPTEAQPIEIVKDFKGLNDQQSSVSRPLGTVTTEKNIFDTATGDADRRAGRDLESLDDGNPVQLIYQFVWDDASIFPVFISGGTAFYNPPYSPPFDLGSIVTDPTTPGPMPNGPNYLALSKNTPFPDLTSCMRALSEARMFSNAGTDDLSWPAQSYAFDAYDGSQLIGSNIRSRGDIAYNLRLGYKLRSTLAYGSIAAPTPGINIPPDFYFADIYAAGVKEIISEMQQIIDNYNSPVLTSYIKTRPIEGASAIDNYTGGDAFTQTLSATNWRQVMSQLASKINSNLLFCKNTTTLTSVEAKSGVGTFTMPCPGNTYASGVKISGYSCGFFFSDGTGSSGSLLWDGTFPDYGSGGFYYPCSEFYSSGCGYFYHYAGPGNPIPGIPTLISDCSVPQGVFMNAGGVILDTINNKWIVQIACDASYGCPRNLIWQGEKSSGSDWLGVYSYVTGSNSSIPSLTIVAI